MSNRDKLRQNTEDRPIGATRTGWSVRKEVRILQEIRKRHLVGANPIRPKPPCRSVAMSCDERTGEVGRSGTATCSAMRRYASEWAV